jgi:hypothetical protein
MQAMDMPSSTITRHDLERRHAALGDLRRYLVQQEQEFNERRGQVLAFVDRYLACLGPLYRELGELESQLRLATDQLMALLRHRGIDPGLPEIEVRGVNLPQVQLQHAAEATHTARLEALPPSVPLPAVPVGADIGQWAPPTLKMLYRRAAMRIHPDRAASETERCLREQQMMEVNAAYAAGERWRLEAMLLAAGEAPAKVSGGNAEALRNWLAHCEQLVQARLRQVNEHMSALNAHAMHKLWRSVADAEARGLDPVSMMAVTLRAQICERRKELYIGQRLKPESSLARAFLHQRAGRLGSAAIH